jgi:hypothetical protein
MKPEKTITRGYRSRITAKEMLKMAEGKTFTIEKNPPAPVRADQAQLQSILQKIDRTVEVIQVGQAFTMPMNVKHSIQRHIKEKHHKMKFRFAAIPDNPDMMRIYRIS